MSDNNNFYWDLLPNRGPRLDHPLSTAELSPFWNFEALMFDGEE